MRITPEMFEILKLYLQGLSAYKIARKLNLDPPVVYASLKAAKTNFATVDKMIDELKACGWPEKLAEVENRISACAYAQEKRALHLDVPTPAIAQGQASETVPTRSEEIAIKLG